eukprot:UC1_evm2s1539
MIRCAVSAHLRMSLFVLIVTVSQLELVVASRATQLEQFTSASLPSSYLRHGGDSSDYVVASTTALSATAKPQGSQVVPTCDMSPEDRSKAVVATLNELRGKGYTVRQGRFLAHNATAFGANPGNPYVVYDFGATELGITFEMAPGAAVLFVGCTPAGVRYFSWRSYLMTDPRLVFASLGDSLNNLVINTTGGGGNNEGAGGDDGRSGSNDNLNKDNLKAGVPQSQRTDSTNDVYGRTAAVVTTGDAQTLADVRAALVTGGLGGATNLDGYDPRIIPQSRLKRGTTFAMLHRASVWQDEAQKRAYFAQERPVYMLTPPSTRVPQTLPLPPIPVRHRGTGVNERSLVPNFSANMAALVAGVMAHFKARGMRLIQTINTTNHPLYGLDCVREQTDCLGDNHDTNYIVTSEADAPALPLEPTDTFVFVGTDCVRNGKCVYSNIGFYKGLKSTPIAVDDRHFNGSTAFYAPGGAVVPADAANRLFAYAVARDCGTPARPFCVPLSQAVLPVGSKWRAIFRTYLEPDTKTGPLVSELVLPRLLHFSSAPAPQQ